MPPLRILILSDGKPGHAAGSNGILKSIELLAPVQHTTIQIKLKLKFTRRLMKLLFNHPRPLDLVDRKIQQKLIHLFYKIPTLSPENDFPSYEWIISSGGDTSYLSAWIHKLYGIKNIYTSIPKDLNSSNFTLTISTTPSPQRSNHLLVPMGPVPIDRKAIEQQGKELRKELNINNTPVWTLLIGGNGAGYSYTDTTMKHLAERFLKLAEEHNAQLLITTSRRTGLKLENRLKLLLKTHPQVNRSVFYNHKPEKVMGKFLGAADIVFCTAESGAMLSESIAAGKNTFAIVPPNIKPQAFYESFLQFHEKAMHLKTVELNNLATLVIDEAVFKPLQTAPIEDIAKRIKPWILEKKG